MQVNKNQMANTGAKLFDRKVLKFLSGFCDNFIGNVMRLIITKIFEIFFVNISFAEFPHNLDILIEQRYVGVIFEISLDVFEAFLLSP